MADCSPFNIKCLADGWLDDLSQGIFGQLEEWVVKSAAEGMKVAVAGWIQVPTPTIDTGTGPVAYLIAYTYPIAAVVAMFALLITAFRIAWTQRSEEWMELARSLVTFVGLTTLGVTAVGLFTAAGDSYSKWIINVSVGLGPGASDTQLGERVLTTLGLAKLNPGTTGLTGLVLVLGFSWLALTSIALTFLTYLRGVLLVVMGGLIPTVAAAGITPGGRPTMARYLAWVAAWVLFKPATATVIASGFWMVGTGGALDVAGGIALLGMCIFMLPFLLRLFVPAAAAFGGGGGGGSGAIGAAAAGAVSLAALSASRGGDDGGSGGGMSVRDVSHGSSAPEGATEARAHSGLNAPHQASGTAVQPAAAGGGAAANGGTGAGPAASGAGSAGGGAGAGAGAGAAAGSGAAAGAAKAAGPIGAAVAGATQVAQAGAQAARGAAGAATGEETSQ